MNMTMRAALSSQSTRFALSFLFCLFAFSSFSFSLGCFVRFTSRLRRYWRGGALTCDECLACMVWSGLGDETGTYVRKKSRGDFSFLLYLYVCFTRHPSIYLM